MEQAALPLCALIEFSSPRCLRMFESQHFVVPNLSHRIELTREKLPGVVRAAEEGGYGVVVNCFEELESDYVKEYQKAKGGKVWCNGPVSLSNRVSSELAQRGNKASIDEAECLKWLDSWPESSVVYVCLGSLSRLSILQLSEIALGLESSNCPFVWVVREDKTREINRWMLENGFEERIKGRGLLIHGWAPEVLILSHSSLGGFLTHCGWNSTLEGIAAGVPMITWPMFADQFYNEKLIVEILKIGESVGSEIAIPTGDEVGVLVKGKVIKEAIKKVMSEEEGNKREERRERARKLAVMAKESVEQGGSSYLNIKLLIEEIAKSTTSGGDQRKSFETRGNSILSMEHMLCDQQNLTFSLIT